MNERLDRFTKLLKEIFELDKSDLDFGIYRVMNLRKAQIEQFLTERLPKMVQETLAPFAQGSKEEIRAKMKQIEESVAEMGMTVDALPNTAQKKQQYLQLQKQLAEGADLAALETDVYSALYSFFNRYYEDGDFISKRRYKEGVYAIPYEGEEVKLYWANQDQYYIKTSENFKDYTFVFDGINVHFRLVDATTEQNNNKESKDNKRAFMLFREDEEIYPGIKTFEYDPDTAEIVIRFVYDIPEDTRDMIYAATGIDIYKNTEYDMSQERCIRKIWDECDDYTVGKLLKIMLDYYWNVAEWDWDRREETDYQELRELEKRLMQNPISIPAATTDTLKLVKEDIERSCNNNIPELALDRLHTFSTEFFRSVCKKHGISTEDDRGNEYPLQSLVGRLKNWYAENHYFDSDFSVVAIQNTINIFDKFNAIRNDQSAAHPNEVLNKAEAMYVVRIVAETLTFIDKIECIKDAAATPRLPWDDLETDDELPF